MEVPHHADADAGDQYPGQHERMRRRRLRPELSGQPSLQDCAVPAHSPWVDFQADCLPDGSENLERCSGQGFVDGQQCLEDAHCHEDLRDPRRPLTRRRQVVGGKEQSGIQHPSDQPALRSGGFELGQRACIQVGGHQDQYHQSAAEDPGDAPWERARLGQHPQRPGDQQHRQHDVGDEDGGTYGEGVDVLDHAIEHDIDDHEAK